MTKGKLIVLAAIALLVAAFFVFDLKRYVSLEYFQAQRAVIDAYVAGHPLQAAAAFFGIYVAVTGLSLPRGGDPHPGRRRDLRPAVGHGDRLLRVLDRATLAFLASRYLTARLGEGKFGKAEPSTTASRARRVLPFALRLVPAFPPLLRDQPRDGAHLDQDPHLLLGEPGPDLAGTVAYVYAGTELGQFKISAGLLCVRGPRGSCSPRGRSRRSAQGLRSGRGRRVRQQPRRHRRRFRRVGIGVHRRSGERR